MCKNKKIINFAFCISKDGLPMLTTIPDKSNKVDNLKAIFSKYTQPIRPTDLRDAIMENENIKKAMAYRRIQEAKDLGVLIENNVGMLFFRKEANNEEETLPF